MLTPSEWGGLGGFRSSKRPPTAVSKRCCASIESRGSQSIGEVLRLVDELAQLIDGKTLKLVVFLACQNA